MSLTRIAIIFNSSKSHEDLHLFCHKLKQQFSKDKVKITIIYSRDYQEGMLKATQAYHDDYRYFVAAGGDGTTASILNGLPSLSDVYITILPLGTANDYANMLGINSLDDTIEALVKRNNCSVDLGEASYYDESGTPKKSIFNVNAGVGALSALYQMERQKTLPILKSYFGILGFVIASFKIMYSYKASETVITVNDRTFSGQLLLLEISKTQKTGLIALLPNTQVNDERLNCIFIEDMSKLKRLGLFCKLLLNKNHLKIKKIHYFDKTTETNPHNIGKPRVISIKTEDVYPVHINGEMVGFTPAKFELIEQKVSFLTPKKMINK